jgi:MFS family permease
VSGSAAAPAAPGRLSPFAVFRKRDFTLLWTAQLVSTAGSALTDLAAAIYVYSVTGSALLVGMTLMATAVPSLIVGLLAGVFVDRYDRRKVMLASNLAQGAVVALIPFLLGLSPYLLFVAILLNAGVKQFFDPAYESIIPEIATDEELEAANAMLSIASFGSTAIGFAGAGLLAAIDIRWAFWIDALTFLFSAGCVLLLKLNARVETAEPTTVGVVIENLKIGLQTIANTKELRSLFLIGAPVSLAFGLWNVLLLPMAVKVLGASEFEYGLQEGLTSVGFVVGSLFMARYSDRIQTGLWIFIGCAGMGISGVLYGLSPTIWIGILWVIVSGFFNSPTSVARQTLLQRNTPRELRGRVFSTMFVMRNIVFLIGMAGAGLADIFPVRDLVVIASLVVLAVGVVALVAPGIGRPAAEWRRALATMRATPTGIASDLGSRPATMGDFDILIGRLATFSLLSPVQRASFIKDARIQEVPEGTRVITHGDSSVAAYFILNGACAVGVPTPDGYKGLNTLKTGDFFGEIAALTGSARTADVVMTEPSTLLEVPAAALRATMIVPEVSELVMSAMTERLMRLRMPDLPRLASRDQSALRELRNKRPGAAPAAATAGAAATGD